eukprot:10248040-Lingulodinium_polyedra.AAC.1
MLQPVEDAASGASGASGMISSPVWVQSCGAGSCDVCRAGAMEGGRWSKVLVPVLWMVLGASCQ